MHQLKKDSNRYQLLKAANLIVWDVFPSNHKEVFEAAYRALDGFQNQVVISFGDFRQITPVVQNGSRLQIVNASIVSSSIWRKYEVRNLTTKMRLLGLGNDRRDTLLPDQINFLQRQQQYADMITSIGEGRLKGSDCISPDKLLGSQTISIPNIQVFTDINAAINFYFRIRLTLQILINELY